MLLSPMESHSSKLISVSSRSSLASAPGSLPQQACTYEHYEQASPSTNLLNIPTSFAAFQPLFSPPGPANTTSLCTHIPTGVVYACRFVRSINGKPSAERIALERIAAQIRRDESPEEGISFLQRLRWIMDNEDGCVPGDGVCIILDHYPNGSLQNYVYHVGMLDASLVQFYAAEIALGLNTLHELGITHGGLSPECVMIDKEGHAVICDFTRAQVDNIHFDYVSPHTDICDCGVTCSCGCRLREGSQCSYLAPEVLLDWKHDSAADSWGFGMVLYFMLFGRVGNLLCWLRIICFFTHTFVMWASAAFLTSSRLGLDSCMATVCTSMDQPLDVFFTRC
ncbi:kinase-like domain-containing protein [Cyathus striatus]|nr:kinase-like domain-containing protein [Cyathus striatus]